MFIYIFLTYLASQNDLQIVKDELNQRISVCCCSPTVSCFNRLDSSVNLNKERRELWHV